MPRSASATNGKRSRPKVAKRRTGSSVLRLPDGWRTSDEQEVERRRRRALEETLTLTRPADGPFGEWLAASGSGERYRVELRALDERVNSCDCLDHEVNGLGTCKHVEAVLARVLGTKKRHPPVATSPRVEIHLDRRDDRVHVRWPRGLSTRSAARARLARFFDAEGRLLGDPLHEFPALERAVASLPARTRKSVRVSVHIAAWLSRRRRVAQREVARRDFEAKLTADGSGLDLVSVSLHPYQQEGVLHLAFTERALLADDMGLGKTVQAIAACMLLERLHGIRRVLVVAPASLKAEWEEQIARFTGRNALLVTGARRERLHAYREGAFFTVVNYEQVRPDVREIVRDLAPDVVVLDEAQRIKNWRTSTALHVKRLASRYAFVLTGTPLENRIDDVYSIVQFLDPHLFGPLFRFNREFYELDEKGRAIGYRNLDALHRRLRAVMLRRRKQDVEGELPGRTVNHYFVALAPEQQELYADYEGRVARLVAVAKRRPLTREEGERLQRALACMRMACDTPYILDRRTRVAPKLDELERLLDELLADGAHKVIVFSEWERMLELARARVQARGLDFAWHTGSTPQKRRRTEITRFKQDPDCTVLLSTDSGSVGLNLQVADVVINLDLPWNPARLEQRIARAWRKHQARAVQVVNLVAEDTIEHRMLGTLEGKRTLAEGVLDGSGVERVALRSGRAALVERVGALLAPPPRTEPATSQPPPMSLSPVSLSPVSLTEALRARLGTRLRHLALAGDEHAPAAVLAVLDENTGEARAALQDELRARVGEVPVEVLDEAAWGAIARLVEAGLLVIPGDVRIPVPSEGDAARDAAARRRNRAREQHVRLQPARRQVRMAELLAGNGFSVEALAPLREGLELALDCLARVDEAKDARSRPVGDLLRALPALGGATLDAAVTCVEQLRAGEAAMEPEQAAALATSAQQLFAAVDDALSEAAGA